LFLKKALRSWISFLVSIVGGTLVVENALVFGWEK